jgi:hypothetical protein
MGMSASEMVRLRMVTGNMVSIYQKNNGDASTKCRTMKIFFQENFYREIRQAGLAANVSRWVEMKKHGLKMTLKSSYQRF